MNTSQAAEDFQSTTLKLHTAKKKKKSKKSSGEQKAESMLISEQVEPVSGWFMLWKERQLVALSAIVNWPTL